MWTSPINLSPTFAADLRAAIFQMCVRSEIGHDHMGNAISVPTLDGEQGTVDQVDG